MSELIGKIEAEFYRNGQMRIIRSGERFADAEPITLTDSGDAIADSQQTPENYHRPSAIQLPSVFLLGMARNFTRSLSKLPLQWEGGTNVLHQGGRRMKDSARRPDHPPVSTEPKRKLVGYMAFNHATGAMCLAAGYGLWGPKASTQIYSMASNLEGTLFHNIGSALVWIDRTIKRGRREWAINSLKNGGPVSWRESDWKWLFRQTWSVVPVFMALTDEHPIKGVK